MNDWKKYYKERTVSSDEAVKAIKSNDRVVIGHAVGEPRHLVEAMVKNAPSYKNVEIVHMVAMGKSEYCKEQYKDNFRHNSIFVGASTRDAVERGQADFTPCFFFEVPKLFKTTLPVDVALVSVTPPDENGKLSLGVSVDYTYAALKSANIVIAQVNSKMPRTKGTVVDVFDIDYFVECDEQLLVLPEPKIGDIEEAIGRNCAALIEDGDTLQMGIGAIPDAVLRSLKGKRNLGIHSETFSDGVIDLVELGVINNKNKTIHTGKIVSTMLMGTQRLYDFVNNNPDVELYPVDYSNNPYTIAQNDCMVSINSAIEVDLMGQVNAETTGKRQFSGIGGQVDFIRGASLAKHGKSIIAMPSKVKNISKIVAKLSEGSAVTTSRCDVDYVVTEYGIAHLKGETLRQRARNLIYIAHPDSKGELIAEYEKRFMRAF